MKAIILTIVAVTLAACTSITDSDHVTVVTGTLVRSADAPVAASEPLAAAK